MSARVEEPKPYHSVLRDSPLLFLPGNPDLNCVECSANTRKPEAEVKLVESSRHKMSASRIVTSAVRRGDNNLVDQKFVLVTGIEMLNHRSIVKVAVVILQENISRCRLILADDVRRIARDGEAELDEFDHE
uniref:Uncharacterized protein n=1 Tax=Homalodisca liturata TaxID=320908 RepID=A0A1B6I2E1_9HEMI